MLKYWYSCATKPVVVKLHDSTLFLNTILKDYTVLPCSISFNRYKGTEATQLNNLVNVVKLNAYSIIHYI